MRLSGFSALGQRLFLKHGHITLPVLLGIVLLVNGLGHAFFNPTREVAIGVVELVASGFLIADIFLVAVRRIAVGLVCYGLSVCCVVIPLVMLVGRLLQQLNQQ
jgi:hypothetical protein